MNTVWLYLDSRSYGGIETHVAALAHALSEHDVAAEIILCHDHGPHPVLDSLRKEGIPVRRFDGLKDLISTAERVQPDLIHSHGYKANIFARIAHTILGVPVVSTFHAGEPGTGRMRIYNEIDKLSGFPFHKIAVSEKIAASLRGSKTLIPNFVMPSKKTATLESNRVLFVGRLSHEKGPDLFCEIASKIDGAEFVCLGDGPMLPELNQAYAEHVTFEGSVSNVSDYLSKSCLVLMPSRHEGLPLAALEAMAAGVPIAALGVGGLPSLINHAGNGFVAPEGEVGQLTEWVRRYLSMSPETRRDIGTAARKTINTQYSPQAAVPQIIDVYNKASRRDGFFQSLSAV